MKTETGWKPMPLSLKILFVLFIIWMLGSVMGLPIRYADGIPFFGSYIYGAVAAVIVVTLDIIGPVAFLWGLLKRKSWAPNVALSYMGIFILNSVCAFFTVKDQLGAMPIIMPALFNVAFLAIIFRSKSYFNK
jgi:hypothetical protein